MIYVDQLRWYGWHRWCHMLTDGHIGELHDFALKIGLKREWFQGEASTPHYDLMTAKRAIAVEAGAIEISDRDLVLLIAKLRMRARLIAFRDQFDIEVLTQTADQESENRTP